MTIIEYKDRTRLAVWKHQREIDRRLSGVMGKDRTWEVIAMVTAVWVTIAVLIGCWIAGGAVAEGMEGPRRAMVVINDPESELNVRRGPGTEYRICSLLSWHEVVVVLEEKEGWALVAMPKLPNAPIGWVHERYLGMME